MANFAIFQILGKISISRDREYFLLVPEIWDILPDAYKTIQILDTFKIKIKKLENKKDLKMEVRKLAV